jgi:uncharacterized protein YbaR (Trm112 family)
MVDKELLAILVCPENHTPLHLADNRLIERLNALVEGGTLKNRSGKRVERQMDGGLVRDDGAFLYPVLDGIPVLLVDEAIPLEPSLLS